MKQSAGILAYKVEEELQVLLVHPGGPFYKNKDAGFWTIPKGEFTFDEDPLAAAQREFLEETGVILLGKFIELTPIKQKGGKVVYAWAIQQEINAENITSNSFDIEWPPKSGRQTTFPEVDKASWFTSSQAKQKINAAQAAFVDELELILRNE